MKESDNWFWSAIEIWVKDINIGGAHKILLCHDNRGTWCFLNVYSYYGEKCFHPTEPDAIT